MPTITTWVGRGAAPTTMESRFWPRVVKTETCWLYGGPNYGAKYGVLSKIGDDGKRRNYLAHRFSYEIHRGVIPPGMFVCHKCDVKNCVNPEHLYVGTHEQNNQDNRDRGNYKPPGNRAIKRAVGVRYRWGRYLDKTLAEQLRAEYASGSFTQVQLAARYRISQSAVCTCIRGATYWSKPHAGKQRNSQNYRRKLSPEQCDEIRALYATGQYTQTELGEKFGVSYAHVSNLVLRKDRRSVREAALKLSQET